MYMYVRHTLSNSLHVLLLSSHLQQMIFNVSDMDRLLFLEQVNVVDCRGVKSLLRLPTNPIGGARVHYHGYTDN